MNKSTFIYILTIAIIASCSHKKPIEKTILGLGTDYAAYPEALKGKVKELKEHYYWAIEKNGDITKGFPITRKELDSISSKRNFVVCFDNTGFLTKYESLDDKDSVFFSWVAINENGKWKRFENKYNGSITSYGILEYDSLGYLISGSTYRTGTDTSLGKQVWTHDGKGNYTKYEVISSKNQRIVYIVLLLNAEGKVIESKLFNTNDSLQRSMKNEYNDKGFLTRQVAFNEKEKKKYVWDYKYLKYDDHGNWLEAFVNWDDGKYKILCERSYIYY